jgi:large subunit ribosomal protein L20
MARVKGGTISHSRRKKILKQAKGFFGSKHLLWKSADEQVLHALKDAYVGRRDLKSDYRKLWIRRINAACRLYDISYSRFIDGLTKAGVLSKNEGGINRKMLSEMAINDPEAFKLLVETAKKAETKPTSVAK